MLIIFPIIGVILAAVTVWIRGITGTDIIFDGLFYAFDYTLLSALCFVAFLFNDIYGYISWQRMKRRQI